MPRRPWVVLAVLGAVVLANPLPSQTTSQKADAEPALLLKEAEAALGGRHTSDITLEANAQWIAGGTRESGAATLTARGEGQARVDISAGSVSRSEIRNDSGGPAGRWSDAAGSHHAIALHNCMGPAAWFAPETLIRVMSAQNGVSSYLGREQRRGVAVDHLVFYTTSSERDAKLARALEKLSAIEIFLDSSSHLPVSVRFNLHLDDDEGRDIPVEIRFADYRNVNGVLVPYRIQRLLQGVLNLDLSVTAARVDSGLSEDQFSLQ